MFSTCLGDKVIKWTISRVVAIIVCDKRIRFMLIANRCIS